METTQENLLTTIQQIVAEFGGGNLLLPTDARFEAYGLADLAKSLEAVSVKQWQPGSEQREANIQTAAQANIAIAFAEFLLAESGTIVVESMRGKAELYTFYRSITFQLYRLANSFHVRLSQQLFIQKK